MENLHVTIVTNPNYSIVLDKLMKGNQNWIAATTQIDLDQQATRSTDLVDNQDPSAVVITCADSRVIPEYIFDTEIGELFVIRIAGNVITPEVLASVEFAVTELNSSIIVMLGHQNCGAVQAKLQADPSTLSDNLRQLVDKIVTSEEDQVIDSVKTNTQYQAKQLVLQSEIIEELTATREIGIQSAIYWMDKREVELLEYQSW